MWAGLTRLERALTVAHNTMVHKTSKTVAKKVGLVKIKDKNTHNGLILTQTIDYWLTTDLDDQTNP